MKRAEQRVPPTEGTPGKHKLPLLLPAFSSSLQVSFSLGLLILTAGIASLSVGYSTPHKIESFGEGDLFFVDTQAVSFNKGLHISAAAGTGLSCLGSALVGMGIVVWILPRASVVQTGESESKWRGFRDPGEVITKPPGIDKGEISVTLSKVENVQISS